jgi:hypothetical protein
LKTNVVNSAWAILYTEDVLGPACVHGDTEPTVFDVVVMVVVDFGMGGTQIKLTVETT